MKISSRGKLKIKNTYYLTKVGMATRYENNQFVGGTILRADGFLNDGILYMNKRLKINKPQEMEQRKIDALKDFYKSKREVIANTNDLSLLFQEGSYITLRNKCKGKGYIGIIKRYNARRAPETHGHDWQRKGRSISQGSTPGQVKKNTKMGGRKVKNISVYKQVIEINNAENYIIVKGDVPGPANSLIKVTTYENISN